MMNECCSTVAEGLLLPYHQLLFRLGSAAEILVASECVVRYGQHQEKVGFLPQRDDGFGSLGCSFGEP